MLKFHQFNGDCCLKVLWIFEAWRLRKNFIYDL